MGIYANSAKLSYQKKRDVGEMLLASLVMVIFMALIGVACVEDEKERAATLQPIAITENEALFTDGKTILLYTLQP